MLGKIKDTVLSIAAILLFASLICNVILYKFCCRKPVIETITERDTVIDLDTIFIPESGEFELLDPVPVFFDSVTNIAVHRDTFLHQYGWIVTSEKIKGDLLSKKIDFEFSIPEYYKTRTITNTITHTVRNDLFFVQGGFNYSFDGRVYPSIGVTYIWNKHNRILSLNYSFDKRIEISAGINLWK